MFVRVKICGITRPGDGRAAAEAGADAVGLVFADASPRYVTIATAADICRVLPPFITRVGVFVDPEPGSVRAVLGAIRLDLLQFHGDEPASFCAGFGVPYVKAVRVRATDDIRRAVAMHPEAQGLLLDTFVAGRAGGTGATFPWELVPAGVALPVILAGGLDESNVATAVATVRPWGVDVSGGVETQPGIKDAARMQRFVAAARAADAAGTGTAV